jgi:outer membrane usher protein
VNHRGAQRPVKQLRWHNPCRRIFLCAAIAIALSTPHAKASAIDGPAANPTGASAPATATDTDDSNVTFDRNMLPGAGSNTAELSRFEHGPVVEAGTYRLDIYLNDTLVNRGNVRFAAPSLDTNAVPCVDHKLLDLLNLHPDKLTPDVQAQLDDPKACVGIGTLIPGATMSLDMTNLRLDTSVPQAYMKQMPRGYVSSEYWDSGVPAALVNYNFNSYRASSFGQSQTTSYLGLNDGFNVGAWHFRNSSAINWQSATSGVPARHQWQNIQTYLQRDLPAWRAQLTVGDSYTDGQVFDSFGIRGVQLGTDDRMLPQSLQGYAPVVRGVADTNAMVTVRQNGALLYQTSVAPGPFEINDLFPTGYGGSLDVVITEADGRVRKFSVPYASLVQLLRPGITRFDIAIGQLRNLTLSHQPLVLQGTVQHGFNNLLTGYAGIQGSQGYASALIGGALNSRFGALALDLTHANARIPGYATQSGQSVRISYSKLIPQTNTSLSVAAYRYSTSGFLSLTDAATARDYVRRGINPFEYVTPATTDANLNGTTSGVLTAAQEEALYGTVGNTIVGASGLARQRSNFTLTLSQKLGQRGGSFYVNASAADYWNRSGTNTQYQVGYNNSFRRVSFNVSATRAIDPTGRHDNQYFISFNLPLGDGAHAPTFSANLTHDNTGGSQEQAMLSGSLGVDNNFNYAVSAGHGSSSTGNSGTINLGYRSPYAVLSGSYGAGSGYSQASVGVSGAIVAHPGGVTFGQPISDTVGVVYAPGAEGARIGNSSGARIDGSGYALVPYLTPYSLNTVTIDPKGLPLNVQLDETSAQVAPYAGAVVMLKFKTQSGRMIIVRARMTDGRALPFGAEVFDTKGLSLGVVGQGGRVLVRGVGDADVLTVRWQDEQGGNHACSFPYTLSQHAQGNKQQAYDEIQATCIPSKEAGATRKAP